MPGGSSVGARPARALLKEERTSSRHRGDDHPSLLVDHVISSQPLRYLLWTRIVAIPAAHGPQRRDRVQAQRESTGAGTDLFNTTRRPPPDQWSKTV
jgi:hypothetical protein